MAHTRCFDVDDASLHGMLDEFDQDKDVRRGCRAGDRQRCRATFPVTMGNSILPSNSVRGSLHLLHGSYVLISAVYSLAQAVPVLYILLVFTIKPF